MKYSRIREKYLKFFTEAPAPINLSANATIHEPNRRNVSLPIIPVTIRKQNTEEGLEEKFGKFGLPPQDPSRYRNNP